MSIKPVTSTASSLHEEENSQVNVDAIMTLTRRITTQDTRITALENKNKSLEQRIERIVLCSLGCISFFLTVALGVVIIQEHPKNCL